MLIVREILKQKGNSVWSVSCGATVADALQLISQKNVGAVLVIADGTV